MDISFPTPTPYDRDEGPEGPPGRAYLQVDQSPVRTAFQGTSSKKSPGPNRIGPLAIRCVYDWEPDRIEVLVRSHIRPRAHPLRWKMARGVTIHIPGKKNYSLSKSYRVIPPLELPGRDSGGGGSMLVSAHLEATGRFRPRQYGCRAGRSAADATGVTTP